MESIIKPRKYSAPLQGADRIAEMQDLDFEWGKEVDTAKEQYSIVLKKHNKGFYALKMTKKVDTIDFIKGKGVIKHSFDMPQNVLVLKNDKVLSISSINYKENETVITLTEKLDGAFMVILT